MKDFIILLLLLFLDLILNIFIPMTLVWIALNNYLPLTLVEYWWLGLGVRFFIIGLNELKIKGDK